LAEKVHRARENPGYAYKKRAPLTLVWGPRMVNPALAIMEFETSLSGINLFGLGYMSHSQHISNIPVLWLFWLHEHNCKCQLRVST